MNHQGSRAWVALALAASMLLGVQAGCSAENVSLGRDDAGAAGGTGEPSSGGSGGGSQVDAEAASCEDFYNTRFRDAVTVR